ncbi:hypothetical protein BpHYR1_038112 [Brachionus plicatilis]|uniref:Uncharacterized protein n=1 Tax=Brachionus plicatilis TaxID=10195 RepID=A0A3M7PD79_BRAPC|nr:hypothetical protein BpHYR1_038112 [Brachionus plicatilis]
MNLVLFTEFKKIIYDLFVYLLDSQNTYFVSEKLKFSNGAEKTFRFGLDLDLELDLGREI